MFKKVVIFKHGEENIEAIPQVKTDEFGSLALEQVSVAGIKRVEAFKERNFPLGANAKYYTPSMDALAFSKLSGIIFTDQAGSMQVQESIDGYDWIQTSEQAVTAGVGKAFSYEINSRFIRIIFVNGATASTTFKINGLLSP
jgi:hypothetical protein